jgi:hypothetical protein
VPVDQVLVPPRPCSMLIMQLPKTVTM